EIIKYATFTLGKAIYAAMSTTIITLFSFLSLAEIREAFRVLDRDGNGFISKQELGMAMRSLGYMPSEVELAIIMQRLDMDGESSLLGWERLPRSSSPTTMP
uniref:EF-hand domain-containing protein n=1 Tax=Meleagris gallopavo TaxID=9103 RepID=A0A803XNZ4_MELGA